MTIARAHLVDPAVSRWYHCITRCVRRAFLLGEGANDRKVWIENRLRELAEIFGVAVGGFSVLDNHLHVLVRLDPEVVQGWSDGGRGAALGAALSAAGQGAAAAGGVGRLGPGASDERGLGGPGAAAAAKPQLVHEVPEGTAVAGKPRGADPGAFLRGGSEAWRSSTKRRCWRPVRISI